MKRPRTIFKKKHKYQKLDEDELKPNSQPKNKKEIKKLNTKCLKFKSKKNYYYEDKISDILDDYIKYKELGEKKVSEYKKQLKCQVKEIESFNKEKSKKTKNTIINYITAGYKHRDSIALEIVLSIYEIINNYYVDDRISPHINHYIKLKEAKNCFYKKNNISQNLDYKMLVLWASIDENIYGGINNRFRKSILGDKTLDIIYLIDLLDKKDLKNSIIFCFDKKKFKIFTHIYRYYLNKYCQEKNEIIFDMIKQIAERQKIEPYGLKFLYENFKKELIEYEFDKNFLQISILQKNIDIYNWIKKMGICDISHKDSENENIFHYLSWYNFMKEFYNLMLSPDTTQEMLLAKSNDKNKTPIYYVFKNWHKFDDKDILYSIIISLFLNFNFDPYTIIKDDEPFIFQLGSTNDALIFHHIYKNYDINLKNIHNSKNEPFIHYLFSNGKNRIYKYLTDGDYKIEVEEDYLDKFEKLKIFKEFKKENKTINKHNQNEKGIEEEAIVNNSQINIDTDILKNTCVNNNNNNNNNQHNIFLEDDKNEINNENNYNEKDSFILELDTNNNTVIEYISDRENLVNFIKSINVNDYVFNNNIPLLHYMISKLSGDEQNRTIYYYEFLNILQDIENNYSKYDLKKNTRIQNQSILHYFGNLENRRRRPFIFSRSRIDIQYNICKLIIKNNILTKILRREIDIYHLDSNNKTCMELAIEKKNFLTFQLLIHLGYDLYHINSHTGYTLIHKIIHEYTISFSRLDQRILKRILFFLLDRYGIYETLFIRDNNNNTPYDLWISLGNRRYGIISNILNPNKKINICTALRLIEYKLIIRHNYLPLAYPTRFTKVDKIIDIISCGGVLGVILLYSIIFALFAFLIFGILLISYLVPTE